MAAIAPGPAAHAAPPALTIYAIQPTVRTSLHLQPGFALIVRADRRVDTVAIGDPRIVAAAPVRRGADVFDVVLQPLSDTGTTNMVLWFGDITTIWSLDIGPSARTADVVFVVTKARAAEAAPPRAGAAGDPATAGAATSAPPAPRTAGGAPAASPPPTGAPLPVGAHAPQSTPAPGATVELREDVGPVKATFRARRTPAGIEVRYEITNGGDADLLIKPAAVLVRADGKPVAYGMARDSVDRGRPDVIPRGATETGMIDIATPSARRLELIVSLSPAAVSSTAPAPVSREAPSVRPGTTPSMPVPIVLQATFSGLDWLPVAAAP